jgi:hypothetical protein
VTLLVLVILAVIWAAVLLPPYLQGRSASRPADSISSFQKQLSVLEHRASVGSPRPVSARPTQGLRPVQNRYYNAPVGRSSRMSRVEAKKRRRDILFTLAGACVITFLMAVTLGGAVWGLNLVCDALLVGYVYLLVQMAQTATERTAKVRYLPARHAHSAEPQLLLRRSGS